MNVKKYLNETHLELLNEWDYQKNILKPYELTYGSNKKVWWICANKHEWETSIAERTRGRNCPYCSGRRIGFGNDLFSLYPSSLKHWDYEKNITVDPSQISPGSEKKVWWLCEKQNHSYKLEIYKKIQNEYSYCSICSNRTVDVSNNFSLKKPKLAKLWHPVKNGISKPTDYVFGSPQKKWFLCKKGHSFKKEIRKIIDGCPYCKGRTVYPLKGKEKNILELRNDLEIKFPKLTKQWHPNKNGNLKPSNFLPGTNKKVWWICKRNHEWQASIVKRKNGNNCPKCSFESTSVPEKFFYYIFKNRFDNTENNKKIIIDKKRLEVDIFIPELNLCIEYDGFLWHKNKIISEIIKNTLLNKEGFEIFRIREKNLNSSHLKKDSFCFVNEKLSLDDINLVLHKLDFKTSVDLSEYEEIYKKVIEKKNSSNIENSLFKNNKLLSNEWNYNKNGSLTPKQITEFSHLKVWWICEKAHEWEARIDSRSRMRGKGCPYCLNRLIGYGNDLESMFPKIADDWNFNKNIELIPNNVVPGSAKKVWWKCKNEHEKYLSINTRIRSNGCVDCKNIYS
jgi:very-short-patch-repair endonuclease